MWKEVSGVRTYFHYADEGLVGEYDDSGVEIKTYGYKPGSTWTTDPLFMKVGSAYYFYHNDHLGTPQKMTSVSGAVVWSAKYKSFGRAAIEVETAINNLRFPGQYFDSETGLYFNWHRNYDPIISRYIRPDPIEFKGGINFYAYAQNNPSNVVDPFGLSSLGPAIPGYDPGRQLDLFFQSLWELFQKDVTNTYCRYGSAGVSSCLDLAGLYLSASGAGLPAGATIFLVSTANNVISVKVCGAYTVAAASELLDIASLTVKAGGIKTQAGLAAADIFINLASIEMEH
ncbi:MAG: hypothetical protein GY702_23035 [Desulfobulbaceae bacterium]|nr:hypothetical protein [Desulfobulbaceae bacterium]